MASAYTGRSALDRDRLQAEGTLPIDGGFGTAQRSSMPLYTQIRETLRNRILAGTYKSHECMPSENELVAAFGVSRVTVRQALNDLKSEGLIFKIHGKGTFVAKPVFGQSRQSLVVFHGGTLEQLESSARGAGATGVWAQELSGAYQLLVVDGPAFVNAPFRAAFPAGIRSATALTLTQ